MKHEILRKPYFLHTFALGNKCNKFMNLGERKTF